MLTSLAKPMLGMPRTAKRLLALSVDASLCVLTTWLAFYLRLDDWVLLSGRPLWAAVASMAIALPIFIVSGLYRAIFRYSGLPAMIAVLKAIVIYGLVYSAIFTAVGVNGIPRTVGLIQPILLLLTVGSSRVIARYWLGGLYRGQLQRNALRKALIYGAGSAGRQLAAAMANGPEMRVVGFLDDDERLHGRILNGLAVYSPTDLPMLVASLEVDDVLLALPSAGRHRRNEILQRVLPAKVSVRTLPSVTDLAQGRVSIADVRELDIDDLLGREPVEPHPELLARNIAGKTVLVTGAGGSIGSELCRQIVNLAPSALLLVEQNEYALYELHQELTALLADTGGPTFRLVPLLASVRDEIRLGEIMAAWRPDTVYHTAAYKHVPLVEHNPAEGVRNNVLGTLIVAKAAITQKVADFVLISTDKAVRPTNVMGATKRLAEMVLQALAAEDTSTKFSMVRFGNVLGSSGSVVPKFRQQIKAGGPVTLTHPEITRYFMTIPEAAQLVIQAGAMANGGDVFVLDMGEPVKIVDLARRMVELSGLTIRTAQEPDGDIALEVTGLRLGEKLYEELLIGDNPEPTQHSRIMKAHEDCLPWHVLQGKLEELQCALRVNDIPAVRAFLLALVSGYRPNGGIVDWIHLERGAEGDVRVH